jgi:hypothetical protein
MSFLPMPPLWMKMTEGGKESTRRENRSLSSKSSRPAIKEMFCPSARRHGGVFTQPQNCNSVCKIPKRESVQYRTQIIAFFRLIFSGEKSQTILESGIAAYPAFWISPASPVCAGGGALIVGIAGSAGLLVVEQNAVKRDFGSCPYRASLFRTANDCDPAKQSGFWQRRQHSTFVFYSRV